MKPTARVFSGMQPTGNLHLGNYLGAMLNWIRLQDTHECIYCVVDMHAITTWQDPSELNRAIRDVTAAYIACGVDPRRSIIFNQSQVGEHAELAWIFNCVARLGWLDRMTQFKEKAGKDKERASVGLYVYPNLMAADILLYHATHVPVGEDQKQHLELARDIAQKFNVDYRRGNRQARLRRGVLHAARAADPGAGDPGHVAQGRHQEDVEIRPGRPVADQSDRRCRHDRPQDPQGASTDPEPLPSETAGLKNRPEAENLVGIYAALAGLDRAAVLADFGGGPFSTFKQALSDLAVARLSPIAGEMRRLTADPAEIDRILADGSARARAIAQPVLP